MKHIVKKLTGKKDLEDQIEYYKHKLSQEEETIKRNDEYIRELEQENEDLRKTHQKDESSKTQITFFVNSDDVTQIKPVTKINPRIIETLIEEGYLESSHQEDELAQHLALMVLANEATEFIIAEFETLKGDEKLFQDDFDSN